MNEECTCAMFKKSDGSVWTMLRDPKCPLHGDEEGNEVQKNRE